MKDMKAWVTLSQVFLTQWAAFENLTSFSLKLKHLADIRYVNDNQNLTFTFGHDIELWNPLLYIRFFIQLIYLSVIS